MGFTEMLTLIFIVLKITGTVTWPWLAVFMPEIAAVILLVIVPLIVSKIRK